MAVAITHDHLSQPSTGGEQGKAVAAGTKRGMGSSPSRKRLWRKPSRRGERRKAR
uniref:Uncharacterized protein n=1 Tax=Arundo donax TaxID=35708 RepID=A0A0A9H9L8_ARUDO